jgi:hypothetical protein
MPTIYREYPERLEVAINNARTLQEKSWQYGPEKGCPDDLKLHTFSGYLTTAFEHHDSITTLLGTGRNNASAFALLRVLMETVYRGLWLCTCGSVLQVEQVRKGKEPFPDFEQMTKVVDAKIGNTGKLRINGRVHGMLSKFVHTGHQQLLRRYNEDGVLVPNYPIEEVIELLAASTLILSCMVEFFWYQGWSRK